MIQSMTSFARKEYREEIGNIIWEMRAVNHRYLEISLRLPETMRNFERDIRDCITNKLSRGKVDVNLTYQSPETMQAFTVNSHLVEQIIRHFEKIQEKIHYPIAFNAMEILSWPGVIETATHVEEICKEKILETFNRCLDEFIKIRQQEGVRLQQFLLQQLDKMNGEMNRIIGRLPIIIQGLRDRLIKRLEESKINYDPDRMEQEILFLIQKYDVNEEIERLQIHLEEVKRILTVGGSVGRRLDFLMQELNRETNTIGSKANDFEVTTCIVEMKVLIEQMREQIQNLE